MFDVDFGSVIDSLSDSFSSNFAQAAQQVARVSALGMTVGSMFLAARPEKERDPDDLLVVRTPARVLTPGLFN